MITIRHPQLKKLKGFVLLIITLFFIYMRTRAALENNWLETRVIGISQDGQCESSNRNYLVVDEVTSVNAKETVKVPLMYMMSQTGNSKRICFDSITLSNCHSVFNRNIYASLSTDDLSGLFRGAANRDYTPFSGWILLVSTLSLLVSQLFEKGQNFLLPSSSISAFSDHNRLSTMTRLNYILCFSTLGLLGASAGNFITKYTEDCGYLYRSPKVTQSASDTTAFCRGILSCGATISSVIEPDDFFFINYSPVVICLAVLLFVSMTLQHLPFLKFWDRRQSILPFNDRDDENGSVISSLDGRERRLLGDLRAIWESDFVPSDDMRANRDKMAESWTLVNAQTMPSDLTDNAMCSICLVNICNRPKHKEPRKCSSKEEYDRRLNSRSRRKPDATPRRDICVIPATDNFDMFLLETAKRSMKKGR